MKEQIRKEVMKVYDQEASVDEVVEKLLVLFGVVGRSEQLKAFNTWFQKNGQLYEWGIDESVIDDYLKSL